MRFFLALLGLFAAGAADAASLRTMTTLHGMNVYLRDLFDDAGKNADVLLGSVPQPGGRITVESAQLNAIARQYGVAWRSVSLADQAVLEWPGHPLKKEDAIDAIRTALAATGAPDDADIDLQDFSPPTVPYEGTNAPAVSQVNYDSNTGQFTAILSITGEAMQPINLAIRGQVEPVVEAPVAVTRLLPETVLRADDIRMGRVRASQIHDSIARSLDQIVGMALRRGTQAGQPLRMADLVRPPLVQRGATVQVQLDVAGLSVSGQAVAMEAGAAGDKIRVQNQSSRVFVTAEVVGPGVVRVLPDEMPTGQARFDHRAFDQ